MSDAAPEIAWLSRDWAVTNNPDDQVATFDRWGDDDVSYTRTDLHLAALAARDKRIAELEAGLRDGVELIEGNLVGPEWKRACHAFVRKSRALLNGGKA